MTIRPATILHMADCHVDADRGLHSEAFASAIDLSVQLDVDLIVISGDLFDHNRIDEPALRWTQAQLERADRPIALLAGNHDCFDDGSVHRRFLRQDADGHVHFLSDPAGSSFFVPGTDIVVWGRAMVEHSPTFHPLEGHPARIEGLWNVVAAHGTVVDRRLPGRSSQISRDELRTVEADYVALGHVHMHTVVEVAPLAVYPGALASSRGGQPGCVLVDLAPGRTARATWAPVDVEACDSSFRSDAVRSRR